jgi:hypothetical protein
MSPRNKNVSGSNSILESYTIENNQSSIIINKNRNGPFKINNAQSTNFMFGN